MLKALLVCFIWQHSMKQQFKWDNPKQFVDDFCLKWNAEFRERKITKLNKCPSIPPDLTDAFNKQFPNCSVNVVCLKMQGVTGDRRLVFIWNESQQCIIGHFWEFEKDKISSFELMLKRQDKISKADAISKISAVTQLLAYNLKLKVLETQTKGRKVQFLLGFHNTNGNSSSPYVLRAFVSAEVKRNGQIVYFRLKSALL